MAYRGRLIFPFLVEIAQLDTTGTNADPDAGGPLTSGYDPDFREARILPTSDRVGASARKEKTAIKVAGQFGSTDAFLKLQMLATGNTGSTGFVVLFHFADLEAAGLVDAAGNATIKVGDRMVAVYRYDDGALIQKIKTSPGAYVTEAAPIFGLNSERNLLQVTFKSRDQGL